jgi:hypothetical protein
MKRAPSRQDKRDLPLKSDVPAQKFVSILSSNDFHKSSSRGRQRNADSHPNSDLVSPTGSDQQNLLNLAVKCYYDENLDNIRKKEVKSKNSRSGSAKHKDSLRPLTRAIVSSQREHSRNSNSGARKKNENSTKPVTENSLKRSINRFKRKVEAKKPSRQKETTQHKSSVRCYWP